MKRRILASVTLASLLANVGGTAARTDAGRATAIDGTYELTRHVTPNGTVVRPPLWTALYTMRRGRFSLNLFFKNPDGTLASESTIGRYSFTPRKYCEWITWTTRNNLDRPGASNAAPVLASHCAPVAARRGAFQFSPPGENVIVVMSADGFTARLDGGGADYWTRIR